MSRVYAILSAYLIACSLFLSIRAFQYALSVEGDFLVKMRNLFNKTNGVLVAALLSTVGMSFYISLRQAYGYS